MSKLKNGDDVAHNDPAVDAPAADPNARVLRIATPSLEPGRTETRRWYWVGLLPTAPQSCVHVGGIAFCTRTETLHRPKHGNPMRVERVPHPRCVIALTDAQLEVVAAGLARRIVRPIPPRTSDNDVPGAVDLSRGQGRVDAVVLSVPTPEEEQAFAETWYRRRPFLAREGDRPLAEFVYIAPVLDPPVRQRSIDAELPDPVAMTGIALGAGLRVDEHPMVTKRSDDLGAPAQ